MSLQDFLEIREHEGVYADPVKVTQILRMLKNGTTPAAAASLVVTASPSLCFGFTAGSSNVSAQWIQVFDSKTLPADGAVPTVPAFPIAATTTIANLWTPPRAFRQGIVICNSSTQHTKTIGSADCLFDVQYL